MSSESLRQQMDPVAEFIDPLRKRQSQFTPLWPDFKLAKLALTPGWDL